MKHRLKHLLPLFLLILVLPACQGEMDGEIDLLIRGGHVIDPANGIDGVMDVAIRDGRIVDVYDVISSDRAERVIDAAGYYVTPGLIDIHGHYFTGTRPGEADGGFSGAFADGFDSVSPDQFTFRNGITTVVDAGTSGWRNFPIFHEQVIAPSDTRVLAFLNIVGYGMWDHDHNQRLVDMDVDRTVDFIEEHSDYIVGTKIGHYHGNSREPFVRAREAARRSSTRLFLECHLPEIPLAEVLQELEPGDIFTHIYGDVHDRESILDDENRLKSVVSEARERGILFDVGHGGVSFHFHKAVPAVDQDFWPDTFGSDLHRYSMNAGMKDMLNIMSKFITLGMPLNEVIDGATRRAARAIGREDLGHLGEGAVADVAILNMKRGDFGFIDSAGHRMDGDRKLQAELTLREGSVVWDLNGLASPRWDE